MSNKRVILTTVDPDPAERKLTLAILALDGAVLALVLFSVFCVVLTFTRIAAWVFGVQW